VSMSAATVLAGMLRGVQPHAIILAAGTRIALPPDLSAKDVPEGSRAGDGDAQRARGVDREAD
jgi:hypothetical protein